VTWKDFIDGQPTSLIDWTFLHPDQAQSCIEDLLQDIPVPDDEVVAAKLVQGAATVVFRAVAFCLDREREEGWKEQKGEWPKGKAEPWTAAEFLEEAPEG
jgi:hypothetical protein